MDKPVSVRDFALSLPAEGSAVVLAMQERIAALEAEVVAYRQPAAKPEQVEAVANLGPFKLKVMNQENYGGEHREWEECITIPAGNPLIAEIVQAAIAAMPPAPVVTDAMVEAGAKAIHQEGWHPSTGRMLARKCLEAALGAKP